MIIKIRDYIENSFKDAPKNKKMQELKEELFSNSIEKYNDQLKNGKSETEAYSIVISGIGDISNLIDSIQPNMEEPISKQQKLRAIFTSISIILYILSPAVLILCETKNRPIEGLILMFIFIALGTGLIIYARMSSHPYYSKNDDTMVEEFKEWQSKKYYFNSFRNAYWSLVVAVYLLISFLFGIWSFSWIIFIVAVAVENIIKGILQIRGGK